LRLQVGVRNALHHSEALIAPALVDREDEDDILILFKCFVQLLGWAEGCRPHIAFLRDLNTLRILTLHNEVFGLWEVDWCTVDDLLPFLQLRLVVIRFELVLLVLLILCVASRPTILVILGIVLHATREWSVSVVRRV